MALNQIFNNLTNHNMKSIFNYLSFLFTVARYYLNGICEFMQSDRLFALVIMLWFSAMFYMAAQIYLILSKLYGS